MIAKLMHISVYQSIDRRVCVVWHVMTRRNIAITKAKAAEKWIYWRAKWYWIVMRVIGSVIHLRLIKATTTATQVHNHLGSLYDLSLGARNKLDEYLKAYH